MKIGAGKEGTVSEHSCSGLLTSGPLSWTWVCLELSLFWGGIVVYFFALFCLVSCISTFPELPYSFWVCRTLWGLKCTKKGKILRWAFLFNFNGFFKVLYYIVENSNRQQTHMVLGAITKWSPRRKCPSGLITTQETHSISPLQFISHFPPQRKPLSSLRNMRILLAIGPRTPVWYFKHDFGLVTFNYTTFGNFQMDLNLIGIFLIFIVIVGVEKQVISFLSIIKGHGQHSYNEKQLTRKKDNKLNWSQIYMA